MNKIEEFRDKIKKFPKAKLGFYPTPLQKLENLSNKYGVNLYMKRDDFSGMSLFGGNKVRKLEYLMGDALAKGCDTVFTYGATQSNHAMQTATVARKCGMKPILYLGALVKPKPEDVRANLLLDAIVGAEVHIVDAPDGNLANANARSFELAKKHIEQLEKQGHKCYDIPPGGASTLGTCGFAEGFIEIIEQMNALGKHADYIFTATGTGGTLAGLVAGKKYIGSDTKIIAIRVSDKPDTYKQYICDLANQCLDLIGYDGEKVNLNDFEIDPNYYAPGYEMPNEMANASIKELARVEGLFADAVYSGKSLSGMIDYIKTGKVEKGSNIVFLHTGGATALFAEQEIIGSLAINDCSE